LNFPFENDDHCFGNGMAIELPKQFVRELFENDEDVALSFNSRSNGNSAVEIEVSS
jgi:hypothetical protein